MFVDAGCMNSTQCRSTKPVIITVLSDSMKSNSIIGMVPEEWHISKEELNAYLDSKNINQTQRKYILQLTSRQLLWEYLDGIFKDFLELQQQDLGFDCQIGTGSDVEYHKVHFVFCNFTADHPQIHDLCGINRNACHVCLNRNPANFTINDFNRDNVGTVNEVIPLRNPLIQRKVSFAQHMEKKKFITKADGYNNKDSVAQRLRIRTQTKNFNSYSGEVKTYDLWNNFMHAGKQA
jgi:hypothetical protein